MKLSMIRDSMMRDDMTRDDSSTPLSAPAMRLGAGPDRLDSWKEIASYLKREVRTVQLWEKNEGLPVHRHFHHRGGTVFAFRSEIEAWGAVQAARVRPQAALEIAAREGRGQSSAGREAYLRGRYFWGRRNEEGMRKAITCFRTAIELDSRSALPYSGLADALTMLSFYEIVPPSEAMPEARRAALYAIELDPALAEAHASLGDIHLHFDRDWEGADREYRQAIQCNPRYALGYHWYANLLAARGQHDAARVAILHALEIDPVSLITQVWAGVTAHLAHRFDDAIAHYESALEMDPQFIWAHMYRAQALEQKGEVDEALREFETTIQLAGGSRCVTAMKAHTLAIAGDRSGAREILRALSGDTTEGCMPSYDMAAAYAALGEPVETVRWLKRACNDRSMKLFGLTQDPRFEPVRHRSEFRAVIDAIGLAG